MILGGIYSIWLLLYKNYCNYVKYNNYYGNDYN